MVKHCIVHGVTWDSPNEECPVCMLVAERQNQIDRALDCEQRLSWLHEWREDLVAAIDIMDRKGSAVREVKGKGKHLWRGDWDDMRDLLLSVKDSIQEQMP